MLISESLKVEEIAIAINNLSADLSGTKIVQLSDLHYDGARLSDSTLERAISLCNDANPDLIVITGDFVTDNPIPITELARRLSRLKSKHGVFGCLGNHDLIPKGAGQKIIAALDAVKIKILWNQVAYPLGNNLAIAGLPDLWVARIPTRTRTRVNSPADSPYCLISQPRLGKKAPTMARRSSAIGTHPWRTDRYPQLWSPCLFAAKN